MGLWIDTLGAQLVFRLFPLLLGLRTGTGASPGDVRVQEVVPRRSRCHTVQQVVGKGLRAWTLPHRHEVLVTEGVEVPLRPIESLGENRLIMVDGLRFTRVLTRRYDGCRRRRRQTRERERHPGRQVFPVRDGGRGARCPGACEARETHRLRPCSWR